MADRINLNRLDTMPRPMAVSREEFEQNWERIFGKKQTEEDLPFFPPDEPE